MLTQSNNYISISLSEDTLKIAVLKGSGPSAKIKNVVIKDIAGISETDLPKVIQASLPGVNPRYSEVIFLVPSSMTTTKNIEIPSVNPEEIKSIVNLQAGRHTPFSREEIQIGYINIGVYKTNYTKVLLVIANRNILKNQLSILEKAGLKAKKVLFAPEGVASLYTNILGLKDNPAPRGIIDVGKQTTDFVVVLKGMAIASRSIPVGKAHFASEGAAAFNRLVDELKKTIESYQGEDIDQLPSRYTLTSDDSQAKELQMILKDQLKWIVEITPYVDYVKMTQGVLKGLAASFGDHSPLDVIAISSSVDQSQVNLMPEEVQLQKSIEDQGREVLKTAIFGFVILLMVIFIFFFKNYFRDSYLNKLTDNYKSNRQEVLELKNTSIRTEIVQDFLKGRMISLDMLNELYRNVPNEIYLTNVFMNEDGHVSIQGVSDIASLVFNLGTSLKESNKFDSVNIKSTTARKDRGKDVSAFEITLKLKGSAKEMKDKASQKEE